MYIIIVEHEEGVCGEIYNIFDTAKILGKPPKVLISNTSGVSGIAHWINSYYGLSGDDAVTKDNPEVVAIKKWVDSEYDAGRVTAISDMELIERTKSFAK